MSSSTRPVRTRFAPSPTGYLHIGSLRTVLYDYFLARQSGGQFVLRVEDTDQERLVPGAVEKLVQVLERMGIDHDEGPFMNKNGQLEERGEYGPYTQSKRLDLYRPYVDRLISQGDAYVCFCDAETLSEMRKTQVEQGLGQKYDRRCLKLSAEEVNERLNRGESHVIRLKIPDGVSTFRDAILGEISFPNKDVDDQILIKSDGFPTYHLAVVVDDHLMRITHVLRGQEWISSTPKQIILHEMLGFEMPVYAHVPLILNSDKTKLSKRQGDVSAESFLELGYLPDALTNFLALLGWNPTGDREIFSREELIRLFDVSKVNKAGAVMNVEKLDWLNNQYIRAVSDEEYLAYARSFVERFSNEAEDQVSRACLLMRERLQKFADLSDQIDFVFRPTLEHDPEALRWKTQPKGEAVERLRAVLDLLRGVDDSVFNSAESLETIIRAMISEKGWGNGDTLWPLRVALSGARQSPGPFELLWVYGKDRSLARIDEALSRLA